VRESRLERITLKRIGLEGARCPESLEYHEWRLRCPRAIAVRA
jgi:hypothetical protein